MLQARVAIVNFESGSYLAELLASIETALAHARERIAVELAVVVFDNASRDGSADACSRSSLAIDLRRAPRNLGFGAAAKLALREASEAWLLVMNADLLVPLDFFVKLCEVTRSLDERVAIAGPALIDEDGTPQPSVGRFPSVWRTLLGIARPRRSRKYVAAAAHRRGSVDWLTGACLILPKAAWLELEGFDPRFFLYYEDVDLCRRASALGSIIHFEPTLSVVHRAPFAQRTAESALLPVVRYSQLLYFRLHRSMPEFLALSAATLLWSFYAALGGSAQQRSAWREVRGLPLRVLRGEGSPVPSETAIAPFNEGAAFPEV